MFLFFLPVLSSPGTSDPYVKFKIGGKEVFRSKTIHKNLNPVWDERVSLLVETLSEPLYVKVSLFFNFFLMNEYTHEYSVKSLFLCV